MVNIYAAAGLRSLSQAVALWLQFSICSLFSKRFNYCQILQINSTVMCLSIWTPKAINFPFVANIKLTIFRCHKIWAHYSLIIMGSNIGTPKNQ